MTNYENSSHNKSSLERILSPLNQPIPVVSMRLSKVVKNSNQKKIRHRDIFRRFNHFRKTCMDLGELMGHKMESEYILGRGYERLANCLEQSTFDIAKKYFLKSADNQLRQVDVNSL